MKLWHCYNARSLRPLWALEEMGFDYDVETLPFPPRFLKREYLEVNPLGTIPYFIDGEIDMTESSAICLYLVEKYNHYEFGLDKNNPAYSNYLNWLFQSDATLTFPQTLVFRYSFLEPKERQNNQVIEDYAKWYLARLRRLGTHLENNTYLCDNRFTIADITITYALHFGEIVGFFDYYSPQIQAYLRRQQERPAFQRAMQIGSELNAFKDYQPIFQLDK